MAVVQETKLLGIILTSDLKWAANTEYVCKKAYKKMWTLRRMKKLDVNPQSSLMSILRRSGQFLSWQYQLGIVVSPSNK